MSLYQKYRAKTFAEIITQDHITRILKNSLIRNNFGHSYLFVGTRGAGKTSSARIFARALNCQNTDNISKKGEPCNECESCKYALGGNHPDIIEMDAASNRGIDEIRNLKESVEFMPSIGRFKVYIIDEVHMMTKEAFNALLKTLEEPPHHIIFLMATTELFKIPATIISRSQVFELKFATIEDILKKIQFILNGENRQIDIEAQKLIAKLGKGSFRDAETILEKVLSSSESATISLEDITVILGLIQAVLIDDIKNLIYSRNLAGLQKVMQQNLNEGVIQNFNYQLSEEVYSDIVIELERGSVEAFKLEFFSFLATLDKDIRSTSSPKMLFIAKVLNFVKNFVTSNILSTEIQYPKVQLGVMQTEKIIERNNTNKSAKDIIINNEFAENIPSPVVSANNPASLIRARAQNSKRNSPNLSEGQYKGDDTQKDAQSIKPISKMDFLEYLKTKNTFLYRFFVHKDFEVRNGKIIVSASKKMELDLLKKITTQKVIAEYASELGVNLVLEVGEPKIDRHITEEKKIEQVSKKVEDLSEGEINDIFKI